MAYCTFTDVNVAPVAKAIANKGWTETEGNIRINEGSDYIDSKLKPMGYTTDNLSASSLIKRLNIAYAQWAILRDIYADSSVAVGSEGGWTFDNLKKWVDDVLTQITEYKMHLYDSTGAIITPGESVSKPEITTESVKRIFTMDKSYTWEIDTETYADEDVVGEKNN